MATSDWSTRTYVEMAKGSFTKDIQTEGGLENQDKLGHMGGGGVNNRDVQILKKFKNKFLFASILNSPSHCEIGILNTL